MAWSKDTHDPFMSRHVGYGVRSTAAQLVCLLVQGERQVEIL